VTRLGATEIPFWQRGRHADPCGAVWCHVVPQGMKRLPSDGGGWLTVVGSIVAGSQATPGTWD
jgi:hypothetical protein